jgi:hypothetical protein
LFPVTHGGKLPERWLYEKSKLFSEGLLSYGKLPERLLFPRNLVYVQVSMAPKRLPSEAIV